MTVPEEVEAQIGRLFFNEAWPPGTIATNLGIHPDVVHRVVGEALGPRERQAERELLAEAFLPFLRETLERYPKIHASRLFAMAVLRGYRGKSQGHFRRTVRALRPTKIPEAFLRLDTLPGEEAQVDWADFGEHPVAGGSRRLMAFLFTLSWCRKLFVHFFWSARTSDFLTGFVEAFAYFGGVPRVVLLDNLKSGVVERVGSIIRYNEAFLALAKHSRFEPRAVGVRRGNEKGKVERSVRYLRENFFAGRVFRDIDDLNGQVRAWCETDADARLWRKGHGRTVGEAFEEERRALLPLPQEPFVARERLQVRVSKTAFVRFDTNDYSVPPQWVGRMLDVSASQTELLVFHEADEVARHGRSYGKHQVVEDPRHSAEIRRRKRAAARHAGLARLVAAVPEARALVEEIANRGENVGGAVSSLLGLLETHGKEALAKAVAEVLREGTPKLKSIHFVLGRMEQASQKVPTLAPPLDARLRALTVTQHDPARYDVLAGVKDAT